MALLLSLPDELLESIAARLRPRDRFGAFGLVCTRLNALVALTPILALNFTSESHRANPLKHFQTSLDQLLMDLTSNDGLTEVEKIASVERHFDEFVEGSPFLSRVKLSSVKSARFGRIPLCLLSLIGKLLPNLESLEIETLVSRICNLLESGGRR